MYVQLADFRASPATHIVSLGPKCATAYNLRRHFDFASAFPFDWWITSDIDQVAAFLEDPDIEKLYDPTLLELTKGGASVRHVEFGFLFHHEFPRHWRLPGTPVQENWRDLLENPKQRTAALVGKMLRLNSPEKRVVFVREGAPSSKLEAQLQVLFPLPCWTLVELQTFGSNAYGWKGDPVSWDKALDELGLTLDRTEHRPFTERSINPDAESKSPALI